MSATVTPGRIVRGRCALCRCRAKSKLYGINVCDYHVDHGEHDRPCPYCLRYALFDPRWTYTTTGEMPSRLVQCRQVNHPNTIFLDDTGECVLSIEAVPEYAPRGWRTKMRQSVVLIGVGMQHGTNFTITQWGTDRESSLFDTVRPTLALARKVYTLGWSEVKTLVADGRDTPWPIIDVMEKTINAQKLFSDQLIPPHAREDDIDPASAHRFWVGRVNQDDNRERVWRHNYLNVLDLAMRVFQIEWPQDREDYDA